MNNISRRSFLCTSGMAAAGVAILPNLISCSRNSIVRLAIIGVGGRGSANWYGLITDRMDGEKRVLNPNVKIVAFCDVDDTMAAKTYKHMPDVPRFKDFRVLFDKMHKEIDAVVISTPDHTHFAATMAAMELGKHVYVEKPLAHDIWQLRTLKKAEEYYGVVTILGNQGHASDGIRDIKEWYDQGVVGEIKEVHAWFNGPNFLEKGKGWFCKPNNYPPVVERVPDSIDWDLWLGPVSERPYSSFYLPRLWRSYYDLGTGMLGDWGCHTLDAAYWTLDLGFPTVIEPIHAKLSPKPIEFIPDQSVLKFEFPKRENKPAVNVTWYEGGMKPINKPEFRMNNLPGNGSLLVGEKHTIFAGGKPWDRSIQMPKGEFAAFEEKGWTKTIRRIPGILKEKQHREFIDAIRGDGPTPGSHFAYGADLTETCILGALAQRFNTRIEYDAENMRIKNKPELNAFIKAPVRAGWDFGTHLWK